MGIHADVASRISFEIEIDVIAPTTGSETTLHWIEPVATARNCVFCTQDIGEAARSRTTKRVRV
jgi:hypothetical protein